MSAIQMSNSISSESPLSILVLRGMIGGTLMGLANLVPGISGGTMLLAAGVYPLFINGIAEVTTGRFRRPSLVVLGAVVLSAGFAILLLAGSVKSLVVDHRWVMYSLFIGLTLGGVPLVWNMVGKATRGTWVGVGMGFLTMVFLAYVQQVGFGTSGGGGEAAGIIMLFVAGIAGASAMILPGISGGYLLLVLGQYVIILSAIGRFKEALQASDFSTVLNIGLYVILPVGLGVLIGIVGVSNLLRILLKRFEKTTLGVLLGLLIGATVGLWPFQHGVQPEIGDVIKGQIVTHETLINFEPEDYLTAFFQPTFGHVGGVLGLIIIGFFGTVAVARIGNPSKG
ncbi:MAG: DUF368 domain-containing protein [Kiritimatiellae bacterium]|nr:DUF368 domain-containing protein [Kiritimatiellia bacterium]